MRLSPNFALAEFTASATARANGIINSVMDHHMPALQATALGMEMVRALFGRPITITSGYRNPETNRLVGGVPDSAHAVGWAADFRVQGVADLDAAKAIRDSTLVFDQLVYEAGRAIHLAFGPELRRQVLRQPGGPGSSVYYGLE